jgi:DNA end-binding protein Ku
VSALKRGSQIPLHEIDRKSGERIHHKNVTQAGREVERENIVKAFEIGREEYVVLEEEEISDLKLPSSDTLALVNFVDISSISVTRFERPYFVLPSGKDALEIYSVFHEALRGSNKAGIGQITLRGREELCAVIPVERGLILETLRYNSELNSDDSMPEQSTKRMKADHLQLARQLIQKNAGPPLFGEFHDHYHETLLELIEAKKAHRRPRLPKPTKPSGKIVDFTEALRKSLGGQDAKPPRKTAARKRA